VEPCSTPVIRTLFRSRKSIRPYCHPQHLDLASFW
jgi:hypothetical protein